MLLAQVFVDLARILVVAAIEAGAIGVERRAPHLVAGEQVAEQRQSFGLLRRGGRALIGGVGGGLAALDEVEAAVGLGVVGLRAQLGERQPRGGVLRIGDDGCAEQRARALVVAGDHGGARLLAQRIVALALHLRADLRGLLAQRIGEPNDVAGEIVAHIGLDCRRGDGGGAGDKDENERDEIAGGLEHVSTLVGTGGGGNGGEASRGSDGKGL